MKVTSKISRTIITVALTMLISTTVFADPTVDSLNQQKQQLQNQKEQNNQNMQQSQLNADNAEKDINNLNRQIASLDAKIGGFKRTISDTNTKISATEADIKISQQNLDKAEQDMSKEQDVADKRIRALYMNGYSGFVTLIIGSHGLDDLLTNMETVEKIISFDKEMMEELKAKHDEVNSKKLTLEKQKSLLLTYKQDNENKLTEVQSSLQQQQQLVAEAKDRQAYYMSQISDYKNKIAQEEKQVQDTIKQLHALALAAAQVKNNGGNTPAAPNAIIAYAYNFLGDPYVWGAEGETFNQSDIDMYRNTVHDLSGMEKLLGRQAFDCSGLTQYVYAHFGIHIGRTTYDQINDGTPVDRNNLKPGDLIFFGTFSDPDHVGMYVGNNSFIEAPYSGGVVRVSVLNDSYDYVTARRIIN